jgi:aspartate aminotransferase-like enzyme
VVNAGAFAQRWLAIARAYGPSRSSSSRPRTARRWRPSVSPRRCAPTRTAVLVQHSESSTGVLHDVRAYAQVTGGTDAILIVDAVSSLCTADVRRGLTLPVIRSRDVAPTIAATLGLEMGSPEGRVLSGILA